MRIEVNGTTPVRVKNSTERVRLYNMGADCVLGDSAVTWVSGYLLKSGERDVYQEHGELWAICSGNKTTTIQVMVL